MEKIRILYLITGLNPGGAEIMLQKIITNLDQDKYEINVCTITNIGVIARNIRPYIKALYYLNANTSYRRVKAIFKLRNLIKEIKPHFLHCFMIHSNLLGRFAAIGLNCKVISSVRLKLVAKRYYPLLKLDNLTQRFVHYYIVNSKTLVNFTVKQGFRKEKVILIENGLELDKFKTKKTPKTIKEELGLKDLPIISMIAHLRKQKDYPTMIAALSHLRGEMDFIFLSVGADTKNEGVEEIVKYLIKKNNLERNIRLLGIRNDIPDILSISDIWVCSTLFEGQSNSLLEAMALSKPIITTNIPENEEVVRDGIEALLVPIKSPKKLAEAILKLFHDKDYANQLAENAHKRVFSLYSINRTIKKLDDLYYKAYSKITDTKINGSLKELIYTKLFFINESLEKHRYLKSIISLIYDKLFLIQEKFKMRKIKKDSTLYKIQYINPHKIKYRKKFIDKKDTNVFSLRFLDPLLGFLFKNRTHIQDGNWDLEKNLRKILNLEHFTSFYKHFKHNIPWKDTEYYNLQLTKLLKGESYYFTTKHELNARFRKFDQLYKKIEKCGYKSQKELIEREGYHDKMGRYSKVRKLDDEISIAIGRNGMPIIVDGIHRLIIAQILDIKKIPVIISIIHKMRFQKLSK